MNLRNTSYNPVSFILLLFCLLSGELAAKQDLKTLSAKLDQMIVNKDHYSALKEQQINSLKNLLRKQDASLMYEFEINQKLYNEYTKFILDSAIFYAERNVEIADLLNDSALIYKSEIDLASLYSYSGKFRESEQILKRIHAQDLPEKLLPDYYDACSRFYSHYASSSKTGGKYRELLLQYRDSLMSCQIGRAACRERVSSPV